ncbi:MAG: hypothetical protein V5A88_02865 [Candidatus Thermoplasmatota archaeon]
MKSSAKTLVLVLPESGEDISRVNSVGPKVLQKYPDRALIEMAEEVGDLAFFDLADIYPARFELKKDIEPGTGSISIAWR